MASILSLKETFLGGTAAITSHRARMASRGGEAARRSRIGAIARAMSAAAISMNSAAKAMKQ